VLRRHGTATYKDCRTLDASVRARGSERGASKAAVRHSSHLFHHTDTLCKGRITLLKGNDILFKGCVTPVRLLSAPELSVHTRAETRRTFSRPFLPCQVLFLAHYLTTKPARASKLRVRRQECLLRDIRPPPNSPSRRMLAMLPLMHENCTLDIE